MALYLQGLTSEYGDEQSLIPSDAVFLPKVSLQLSSTKLQSWKGSQRPLVHLVLLSNCVNDESAAQRSQSLTEVMVVRSNIRGTNILPINGL